MGETKVGSRRLVLALMALTLGAAVVPRALAAVEPALRLSVADAAVDEGDSGTTPLTFTVRLSRPNPQAIRVPWSTAAGTAESPADFQAASGEVTIAPRATTATVTVAVVADRVDEDAETLEVRLGTPSLGRVDDGVGVGTIMDDDTDRQLTATVVGNGSLSSTPAGISCTADGSGCIATYEEGTPVTLTAAPAEGERVQSWGGACADEGTATTCPVVLDTDVTVGVSFEPDTYTVSVQVLPGEAVVTSDPEGIHCGTAHPNPGNACSGWFAAGTSVTLFQTPSEDREFAGWAEDCAFAGTAPTCTLTMTADFVARVTYVPRPVVSVLPPGNGVVTDDHGEIDCRTGDDDCFGAYDLGDVVTLTAAADPGFRVAGWDGACAHRGSAATCTLTMAERITYGTTATFAQNAPVPLRIVREPQYGFISSEPAGIACGAWELGYDVERHSDCEAQFPSGSIIQLNATGAPVNISLGGFSVTIYQNEFVGWAGACSGSSPTCTLTLPAGGASVCAIFRDGGTLEEDLSCLEIPAASYGGRVVSTPAEINCGRQPSQLDLRDCLAAFDPGSAVVLEAEPAPGLSIPDFGDISGGFIGHSFSHWEGACAGQGAVCSLPPETMHGVVRTCAVFLTSVTGFGAPDRESRDPASCEL